MQISQILQTGRFDRVYLGLVLHSVQLHSGSGQIRPRVRVCLFLVRLGFEPCEFGSSLCYLNSYKVQLVIQVMLLSVPFGLVSLYGVTDPSRSGLSSAQS